MNEDFDLEAQYEDRNGCGYDPYDGADDRCDYDPYDDADDRCDYDFGDDELPDL
jgi:hypothetical protein